MQKNRVIKCLLSRELVEHCQSKRRIDFTILLDNDLLVALCQRTLKCLWRDRAVIYRKYVTKIVCVCS